MSITSGHDEGFERIMILAGGGGMGPQSEFERLKAALKSAQFEIEHMKQSGWRNHSVNYARAEKCPQTLEAAQASWDRDQELIEDMRKEISRLKETVNDLRQKLGK